MISEADIERVLAAVHPKLRELRDDHAALRARFDKIERDLGIADEQSKTLADKLLQRAREVGLL